MNTNHPNDLDLEHCNKIFKDEAHSFRGVFTEKTVSRVSRSAVCTHNIITNFDAGTNTHTASGVHTKTDLTQDIYLIANQLKTHEVFKNILNASCLQRISNICIHYVNHNLYMLLMNI